MNSGDLKMKNNNSKATQNPNIIRISLYISLVKALLKEYPWIELQANGYTAPIALTSSEHLVRHEYAVLEKI